MGIPHAPSALYTVLVGVIAMAVGLFIAIHIKKIARVDQKESALDKIRDGGGFKAAQKGQDIHEELAKGLMEATLDAGSLLQNTPCVVTQEQQVDNLTTSTTRVPPLARKIEKARLPKLLCLEDLPTDEMQGWVNVVRYRVVTMRTVR